MGGHHIGVLALICSFLLVLPLWSENIQSNVGDDKPILPSWTSNEPIMVDNDETPIIEELKKGSELNSGEPHKKTKKRKKKTTIKNKNKKLKKKLKKNNKKKNKYKNNSTRIGGTGGSGDYSFCSSSSPCRETQGDCDYDYDCAGRLICGKDNCQDFHSKAYKDADCCIQDNCGKELSYPYTKRIIGGSETAENQYPWMVRFPQGCGGSLITDRHILTARHCLCWEGHHSNFHTDCFFYNKCNCETKNYEWVPTTSEASGYWWGRTVKVSVHNKDDRTDYQEVPIKEVKWPQGNDHDFAMVILDEPVDLTYDTIGTVCLPSGQITDYKGKWALALGWGDTIDTGKGESPVLKQAWLKVSQKVSQNPTYGPTYLYTDTRKVNNEQQSVCDGDSGGPLLYRNFYTRKWTIIGTLHGYIGGRKTCLTATENIWNKITAHLDWIKKIVKK